MSRKKPILDPLWITQGSGSLDAELLKYVLLAANKKFRDKLDGGDISDFNEIVFHTLNLNNLAVEGTVFNFNLKPVWDNPRLIEIRESLRRIYQIPEEVLEVFKSANYLFTSLLIDYLEKILDVLESCDIYTLNTKVHQEKEIFFMMNRSKSEEVEIWKLRFDSRMKMGSRLERIDNFSIGPEDQISDSELDSDARLKGMDLERNTVSLILRDRGTPFDDVANSISSTVAFTRGIGMGLPFNTSIMEDLYEILTEERVLPFTIKTWI
jgi:hypothetical protein